MWMFRFLLPLAAALAVGAAQAEPITVSGVKYEDTADLRGSKLQLNGAGIRYKAIIKVYTAGLYLTRKAGTPEEVAAAPGPKRLHIVMLREIDSTELGKLFTRGVEDNMSKADFSKLVPGLLRMGQIFSDQKKLSAGDTFSVDWVPGTGTIISVRGVPQGEPFKEPEFYNAMMSIWLGKSPADWKLKDALLGKAG
jgi:hypothetical protein